MMQCGEPNHSELPGVNLKDALKTALEKRINEDSEKGSEVNSLDFTGLGLSGWEGT